MSYQVIARKWRPQTFEEVTGQETITHTLKNAIENDRLHHAYIFSGSRGVGKTTTARLLAKALNCHKTSEPNPDPCRTDEGNACASCKEISESRSIDVFEFDAASHTGVDDIRELILESININPARDRFKIFIIDEVHMLSNSSFNALLKTLEEPPPRVAFIMATTELHKLPDTILSRCQEFLFRSIPLNKIFDRLKLIADAETINISEPAIREIARSGEGSMRDAQSNFDQVISFSGEKIDIENVISALGIASAELLTRTISAIADSNSSEILKVVDELVSRGQDLRNFSRDLLAVFRDLVVVKMAGDVENLLDTAVFPLADLQKLAQGFSESDLIRYFNSLSETEMRLHDALQPRYLLEIGLIKLVEMRRVHSIEEILRRLSALEGAPQPQNHVSAAPTPEKKTLISNAKPEDAPFPVNSDPIPDQVNDIPEEPPDFFESTINENFISRLAANSPEESFEGSIQIASEELEHFDDNWLDAAYEKKLALSGSEISLIATASEIAAKLPGYKEKSESVAEIYSRSANAGVGGSEFSHLMPDFSADESYDEMPLLPDNPTGEELMKYAHAHPVVKKALRIFRGKIVDVRKKS